MESSKVTVSIFGQEYTIRGDADPQYIKELAAYVNGKMEEYSAGSSTTSITQVAILAALNIADEYFQMKDIKTGSDGAVLEKASALISLLDQGLMGDTYNGLQS